MGVETPLNRPAAGQLACTVQQFAKAPVAGAVKTRMLTALDAQQACELHCELALHTLGQLRSCGLGPLQLWVAGDPLHRFFQPWCPVASVHRQRGADLGQRMYRALLAGLAQGPKVLLVGSDCPFLDAGYLQQAARVLDEHDVVLGPAEDGGYVLIGARRILPAVFEAVPWGSAQVLSETCTRLRAAQLSWHCLEARRDIDTPEDLPVWHALRAQARS